MFLVNDKGKGESAEARAPGVGMGSGEENTHLPSENSSSPLGQARLLCNTLSSCGAAATHGHDDDHHVPRHPSRAHRLWLHQKRVGTPDVPSLEPMTHLSCPRRPPPSVPKGLAVPKSQIWNSLFPCEQKLELLGGLLRKGSSGGRCPPGWTFRPRQGHFRA